jgi:long-subunit acyl-CoA synthetase (AMP-forming)
MSPTLIEAELKAASDLIAHVCVIGDARPYNVALIVLDPEMLAARGGEDVQAALAGGIEAANARLARVEQIKRFRVLEDPWSPVAGQLTPTLKLRRGPISEMYAAEIEALYAQSR